MGPYVTYTHLAIVSGCVPVMFAVSFVFFPESPYYLLARGRREKATRALQWLRGQSRAEVQEELDVIQVRLFLAREREPSVTSKLNFGFFP